MVLFPIVFSSGPTAPPTRGTRGWKNYSLCPSNKYMLYQRRKLCIWWCPQPNPCSRSTTLSPSLDCAARDQALSRHSFMGKMVVRPHDGLEHIRKPSDDARRKRRLEGQGEGPLGNFLGSRAQIALQIFGVHASPKREKCRYSDWTKAAWIPQTLKVLPGLGRGPTSLNL